MNPFYFDPNPVHFYANLVHFYPNPVHLHPILVHFQPNPVHFHPNPVDFLPYPVHFHPFGRFSAEPKGLKRFLSRESGFTRLVAGEKSVYKKRGEQDPEVGAPQGLTIYNTVSSNEAGYKVFGS